MLAALGNHLWQSTLFVVATGLLTLVLRNNSAGIRHGLWVTASLKFLVPFSLLLLVGSRFAAHDTVAAPSDTSSVMDWSFLMEKVTQPLSPATQSVGTALATTPAKQFFSLTSAAVAIWICGIIVVLCVALVRWLRISAALRAAEPFGAELQLNSPIPVKESNSLLEPGVIGILRPVLLLPQGIGERLPPEQLQAIVAHELCHVRRWDNLTGALHLLVEAVFWFFPPVWWLGARILEERERACDEAVVASGNDPTVYAEGLLNVCELYLASPLVCAAGVSGANLKKRIEAIVRNRVISKLPAAKKALLAMTAVVTVAVPVVTGLFRAPPAGAQVPAATISAATTNPTASIKLGSTESTQTTLLIHPDGVFTLRNMPLKTLISFAYEIQEPQISGPADKLATLYSMDAKTAAEPSPDHMQADFEVLIQGILAERFKLASHWETRRVPVYAVLGGNNSGIKQAAAGEPGPLLQRGVASITAHAVPFALFTRFLASQLNRPILDQTGLTATYDLAVKWGPEPGTTNPNPDPALLIESAQKQLGIQLVPQEGDVKLLIVDNVSQPDNLVAPPKVVTLEPGVFDRYVGHYAFPGSAVMTVSRDGARFFAQLSSQPPTEIFPSSQREFFAKVVEASLSFTTDSEGVATQLVLHQNGRDITAPRITEAAAKARADELARRVREQKAAPGSEAALRKHIEALQRNQPDLDDMDPTLAAVVRPQWAAMRQKLADAGQVQSIQFTAVGPGGADIYRVQFENGTYEMRIALDSTGKISGLRITPTQKP